MARGGFRPGAGRPKGVKTAKDEARAAPPRDVVKAARKLRLSPLDYMLAVMNDEEAESSRRDRMAVAAAPFVHARPAEGKGKKEEAADAAKRAGAGSEWGDDLAGPEGRPN